MSIPSNNAENTDPSLSLKDVFILLRFVNNSIFRHKFVVITCMVLTISLALVAIKILPRTYLVTSRIMTHSSSRISTLTSESGRRYGNESATFGVPEIMKSRENLIGIIQDAKLAESWAKARTKTGRILDPVFAKLFGPPTEKDFEEMLINTLDKRLEVWVQDNVVVLRVMWHDPQIAFEIQQVLIERFFSERKNRELAEITETINLLEKKYTTAREKFETIAEKNEALNTKTAALEKKRPNISRKTQRSTANVSSPSSAQYDQASAQLVSIQREISRLNDEYERRISAEKAKLAQIETTYGPQHPDIIKSKRYIELLTTQDPVPAELKVKERSLSLLLEKLDEASLSTEPAPPKKIVPKRNTPVDSSGEAIAELTIQSQLTSKEYVEAEVAQASIGQRLANAKMELEATEAAFNYRYRLTRPPVFPKRPIKPNGLLILIGSVFLSVFMGVFFATFIDVRSGVIIESWQIEKILDIPILDEVNEK